LTRVDEILGERADDAVTSGIELADPVLVLAGGLDDTARRSIDDGGDAAGLRVESIPWFRCGHTVRLNVVGKRGRRIPRLAHYRPQATGFGRRFVHTTGRSRNF